MPSLKRPERLEKIALPLRHAALAAETDVLVVGGGGREHALAWALKRSPRVRQIFVSPGNAGTAGIATNVPISDNDIPALVAFSQEQQIGLTVVLVDPGLLTALAYLATALQVEVLGSPPVTPPRKGVNVSEPDSVTIDVGTDAMGEEKNEIRAAVTRGMSDLGGSHTITVGCKKPDGTTNCTSWNVGQESGGIAQVKVDFTHDWITPIGDILGGGDDLHLVKTNHMRIE